MAGLFPKKMLQVEEHKVGVLLTTLMLLVRSSALYDHAEGTFNNGTSYQIACTGNANDSDTYVWKDTTFSSSIGIFTINSDTIAKTDIARDIPKYNNFFIESQFPASTSLLISDIGWDDKGSYTCELLSTSEVIKTFIIHVESKNSSSAQSSKETFLEGSSSLLECIGFAENSDTYLWVDITNERNTVIYTVNQEGITKGEKAQESRKYDNFLISSQFPFATSLTMSNVAVEDEGQYACELLVASVVYLYIFSVEVSPNDIAIACLSDSICPPPPPDITPSKVDCVCRAARVYPLSLQLVGNGAACSQTIITPGEDETVGISCNFEVYPSASQNSFQCEIDGYVNDVDSETTYVLSPPICELLVQYNHDCTIATLTCSCINAAPDINLYSFYDGQKRLYGSPKTREVKQVTIRPNEIMTFYCRGCNGVNYGLHSFAKKEFTCFYATERPKATTIQTTSGCKTCNYFWILILTGLTFTWLKGYR